MFERYGGFAAVHKVVMAFYDRALDSDVIGPYFENTDMRSLVDHQTKFISQVMGGPSVYTDEALRQLHERLNITDEAFDEMVRLMIETFEDFDMRPADVSTLASQLRARRSFIVRPGKP
jgi:hemoglobin